MPYQTFARIAGRIWPKVNPGELHFLTGAIMNNRATRLAAALGVAAALTASSVSSQQSPAKRDFEAEITKALASAKEAAGFEFLGTLVRTCLVPQSEGENTSDVPAPYITDPSKVPPRESWYTEPAKVFDNFYFVGGKVHSAWALTTKDGIILFDTIYPYNSEELIIGGMKKVGLDPRNIKYLMISHAHGDHIGGAEMLQTRYGKDGLRVVMTDPDWTLVEKYPNRYKTMAPRRDITATDGMKITLGESTVNITHTPGYHVVHVSGVRQGEADERGVFRRHGVQLQQPHARPRRQELPDLHRLAAQVRRQRGGRRRHRADVESLGVRHRRYQEQDARIARQRPASVPTGRRRGAALFQGDAGVRACGAVKAGAKTGGGNRQTVVK
jgi:hypothetical protein